MDTKGRLWIGTRVGLILYENGRFFASSHPDLGRAAIREIVPDGDGVLLATNFGVFRATHDSVEQAVPGNDLRVHNMTDVLRDRDGNLWVTGQIILYAHNGKVETLEESHGISGGGLCLLEAPDEGVFIGTNAGLVHLTKKGSRTFTTDDGLVSNLIRSLAMDHDGNV